MLERFTQPAMRRLGSVRKGRRALVIILIWALLFGALIAFDALVLRDVIDNQIYAVKDISYYRERTQAILDGKWLYRDVPCESPPLIVYMMIPAQLAGGGYLAYQVWFSIFVLLTSLSLYWALRRFDDDKAFFVGLLFLFVPVGTVETVIGIQDEAIVVWVFVLSILLALMGRLRWSAFAVAIGGWTKLINFFFYPFLYWATPSRRERLIGLGIIALVSLAVALPYLIVCPVEFLKFPLYYFLSSGEDVPATGGTSIWDFLAQGGLDLPGWFFLALTIGALLLAFWYARSRRLGLLAGTLVVLTAFVVVYSRSAAGYFMLPIALLLIWGVEDRWLTVRCFVIYLPLILSAPFASYGGNPPFVDVPWGWIVGLFLQIIALAIILDCLRLALRKTNFVDRALAGGAGT